MTTNQENGSYKRMTWPELRERAKGQWAAIFEDLAPAMAQAVGNAPLHVPCPVHGGEDGYRLFEHFNDTGRGICNSCGPQKSGFETLAWVKANALDPAFRTRGYTFEDAVREVAQWVRAEQRRPARVRAPAMPILPKMDPALAFRKISMVWRESTELKGTAVERYLVGRGIWAENLPRTLRAHPGLPYYDAKTKTVLGTYPCLLAPIRDKSDKLVSLHRIFLTPDGFKANVPDPKKMMPACGEIRGAAIKLFNPSEVLGLAEGIETALAAHAISRLPVWACVTAGLMEVVEIPSHVKHVVIWADLDRSERGVQAADTLADRVEASGRTVEICVPQGPIPGNSKGVDWLDVMLTRGLTGFPAKWRRWRPPAPPQLTPV
jgi:putative DNA primase/helicase